MQEGHGLSRALPTAELEPQARYRPALFFLAGAFTEVALPGVVLAGIKAELERLLVRMPHTVSNAFLPALPGFGRSQTIWAWSRGSTAPSSRTSTFLTP